MHPLLITTIIWAVLSIPIPLVLWIVKIYQSLQINSARCFCGHLHHPKTVCTAAIPRPMQCERCSHDLVDHGKLCGVKKAQITTNDTPKYQTRFEKREWEVQTEEWKKAVGKATSYGANRHHAVTTYYDIWEPVVEKRWEIVAVKVPAPAMIPTTTSLSHCMCEAYVAPSTRTHSCGCPRCQCRNCELSYYIKLSLLIPAALLWIFIGIFLIVGGTTIVIGIIPKLILILVGASHIIATGALIIIYLSISNVETLTPGRLVFYYAAIVVQVSAVLFFTVAAFFDIIPMLACYIVAPTVEILAAIFWTIVTR